MGIGIWEFLLVYIAAIMLFGPSKVFELCKKAGQLVRQLGDAVTDIKDETKDVTDAIKAPVTEIVEPLQNLDLKKEINALYQEAKKTNTDDSTEDENKMETERKSI